MARTHVHAWITITLFCFILALLPSLHAEQSSLQTISSLFGKVQNNSGSEITSTVRSIWKTVIQGNESFSLFSLRNDPSRSGVVIYTGVYGPPGNRIVRMLLYANFAKWPHEDVVGKLSKIKSWYFDYSPASILASEIIKALGGDGSVCNGMKITIEQAENDYVAIFLSKTEIAPPPTLRIEVGSSELDYYR